MRTVSLDLPLLCATPWAFFYLLRSQGLTRRRDAVLFSAWAGFATLVKGQALLFFFLPGLYVLLRSLGLALWRRERWLLTRALQSGALVLATLVAVTSFWWSGRLLFLVMNLLRHIVGANIRLEWDASWYTPWGGVAYYFMTYPLLTSGPLALAFLLLTPTFLLRNRDSLVMVLWVFGAILLHMAMSVRNVRYLFPVVPAVAVVLAVGLYSLRCRRTRQALSAATLVLAIGLWLSCSFSRASGEQTGQGLYRPTHPSGWPQTAGQWLSACGSGCYTAIKDPRRFNDEWNYQPALALQRWLQRHHRPGEPLLIYHDFEPNMLQLISTVQRTLPQILWMDVNPLAVPITPPPSYAVYAIVDWPAKEDQMRSVYTLDCYLSYGQGAALGKRTLYRFVRPPTGDDPGGDLEGSGG